MEKQTGAKISIRGKGSAKDGKGAKKNAPTFPDDDDELHVLIAADTNEQVKQAAEMIEKLLIPVEEGRNEHKRLQLRKLAEINGTLRDNLWEHERTIGFIGPQVACAHCGELSHPSTDCPFKGQPGFINRNMDKEFDLFLQAIGDKDDKTSQSQLQQNHGHGPPAFPIPGSGSLTEEEQQKEFEKFMASINEESKATNQGPPMAPWQQQQQYPNAFPPQGPPPMGMSPYGPPPPMFPPQFGQMGMGMSPYGPPPGIPHYGPPAPPPWGRK